MAETKEKVDEKVEEAETPKKTSAKEEYAALLETYKVKYPLAWEVKSARLLAKLETL